MGTPFDRDLPKATSARLFQATFESLLDRHPGLNEVLSSCGYPGAAGEGHYPTAVWCACLEAAAKHLYPSAPPAVGLRALGRTFAETIFKTDVGRAYAGVSFTVQEYLRRIPIFVAQVRSDLQVEVVPGPGRTATLQFRGPHQTPDFWAGILEVRLGERQLTPKIELRARPDATELDLQW